MKHATVVALALLSKSAESAQSDLLMTVAEGHKGKEALWVQSDSDEMKRWWPNAIVLVQAEGEDAKFGLVPASNAVRRTAGGDLELRVSFEATSTGQWLPSDKVLSDIKGVWPAVEWKGSERAIGANPIRLEPVPAPGGKFETINLVFPGEAAKPKSIRDAARLVRQPVDEWPSAAGSAGVEDAFHFPTVLPRAEDAGGVTLDIDKMLLGLSTAAGVAVAVLDWPSWNTAGGLAAFVGGLAGDSSPVPALAVSFTMYSQASEGDRRSAQGGPPAEKGSVAAAVQLGARVLMALGGALHPPFG
jgi:hypothetical protein